MKQMAKGLLFGAGMLSLTAAGCFPAAAASIDQIRIRLKAEDLDEKGMPILEAESRDKAYTVTGVERISGDLAAGPAKEKEAEAILTDGQSRENIQAETEKAKKEPFDSEESRIEERNAEESAPEILYEIELESDADDSFSVLRQEEIQFSGLHAVCSKAVRKDNGCTLLLTIELQDAGEIVGTVDAVEWVKSGIGKWKKAPGAAAYLVMLYRDAKRVGHPHRTRAEQYDFAPLMQEPGTYHFKVMPLTKREKRGRATESVRRKVTEEEAAKNREEWGKKAPGWQLGGEVPSYILKDGAYPQMDALLIGESYEQFNERGEKIESDRSSVRNFSD